MFLLFLTAVVILFDSNVFIQNLKLEKDQIADFLNCKIIHHQNHYLAPYLY